MPTSASNIIVKNGTKNTVVSADDVNINGTSVINTLSSKQDVLTPGTGIDITNNVISSTLNSAQWGNITGTISNQTDLQTTLNSKQNTLVSGTNIKTINGSSVLGSGNLTVSATAAWGSITGTLSNQTDLQNALNAKANDSDVVKLTGNQTISGTKTFSSSPIVPTPATSDNSTKIATTAYVKAQGYQTAANLVTSVSSSSTDSQYPSAKLFYDTCGDIETLINAL